LQRERRQWAGQADEQKAVYANRRRVQGEYGKKLLKKRGERIERSFAHCYETGATRRVYLRVRESVLQRQWIHVGAFNRSLIFRQTMGAGTPRELRKPTQPASYRRFLAHQRHRTKLTGIQEHPPRFGAPNRCSPALSIPKLPLPNYWGLHHGLLD
jgi:hypothetical protein